MGSGRHVANISVKLASATSASAQPDLATALRQEFREWPRDASVFTNATLGIKADLTSVRVTIRMIERAAERILPRRRPFHCRGREISTKGQKPELDIQMNRGLAGSLGITVGQVAQALRPAFAGIDAGDWVDPSGETRDVMVRLTPGARERVQDLAQLPILFRGSNGLPATVPLEQVASIRQSVGPAQINHLDGDRVVNVDANRRGRSAP